MGFCVAMATSPVRLSGQDALKTIDNVSCRLGEANLLGTEYEIRLRNRLMQKDLDAFELIAFFVVKEAKL